MLLELSIKDRVKLSELLESEASNYARMKLIREFREDLSLSVEEIKLTGYSIEALPDGGFFCKWDKDKDPMKQFNIGEIMQEIISGKLKDLNDTNRLTSELMGLYESFNFV